MVQKGNKCYATSSADTPPALAVLGADVELTGPEEKRKIGIIDLYSGDGAKPLTLGPTELVTRIILPQMSKGTGSAFRKKARRTSMDFPLVNAAAAITLDEDGQTVLRARLAFSGVTMSPVLATAAAHLVGKIFSIELAAQVSKEAVSEVKPVSSSTAVTTSVGHRRRLLAKLAREAK